MHIRSLAAGLLAAGLLPVLAIAASGDTVESSAASADSSSASSVAGFGTITVEQTALNGAMGSWRLLQGQTEVGSGADLTKTLSNIPSGLYTIFMNAPAGAATSLRLYKGTEQIQQSDFAQMSFTLPADTAMTLTSHYQFTKFGTVSVTSDPAGIAFTLSGPNGLVKEGTAPQSFDSVPEGQYKVEYHPPSGCGVPPPKGSVLDAGGRISFTISLSCKAADALRERQGNGAGGDTGSSPYISVTIGGSSITLKDVTKDSWFAPYVAAVTKAAAMSGYKDAQGNPTGEFGPANPVTVAELAKIAHSIGGLAEQSLAPAANPLAKDTWFSGVIASAEERGWTIYSDATIDPTRPATRGEVLVTLLQVLNVPLSWQTGSVFTDVQLRTPFAAAIETAAKANIVSGSDNGDGTKAFHPTDPINRAELAKILSMTLSKYSKTSSASSSSR